MKAEAKMRYSFEASAREVNTIRRALEFYAEQHKDKKGIVAAQLATSITKQIQTASKAIHEHFTAMLSIAMSGEEEES